MQKLKVYLNGSPKVSAQAVKRGIYNYLVGIACDASLREIYDAAASRRDFAVQTGEIIKGYEDSRMSERLLVLLENGALSKTAAFEVLVVCCECLPARMQLRACKYLAKEIANEKDLEEKFLILMSNLSCKMMSDFAVKILPKLENQIIRTAVKASLAQNPEVSPNLLQLLQSWNMPEENLFKCEDAAWLTETLICCNGFRPLGRKAALFVWKLVCRLKSDNWVFAPTGNFATLYFLLTIADLFNAKKEAEQADEIFYQMLENPRTTLMLADGVDLEQLLSHMQGLINGNVPAGLVAQLWEKLFTDHPEALKSSWDVMLFNRFVQEAHIPVAMFDKLYGPCVERERKRLAQSDEEIAELQLP